MKQILVVILPGFRTFLFCSIQEKLFNGTSLGKKRRNSLKIKSILFYKHQCCYFPSRT